MLANTLPIVNLQAHKDSSQKNIVEVRTHVLLFYTQYCQDSCKPAFILLKVDCQGCHWVIGVYIYMVIQVDG
uniref:Uncharacterized protein n=1 Tax=Oryza brachyantha TaxID=4533 RepID=J3LT65_ORYBR